MGAFHFFRTDEDVADRTLGKFRIAADHAGLVPARNQGMKWGCRAVFLFALLTGHFAYGDDERMPPPPYPEDILNAGLQGQVVVSISFSSSGGVAECRVVKTTATKELTDKTVSWVRSKWHSMIHAGSILEVPISYSLAKLAINPAPRAPSPFQPGFSTGWQIAWYHQFADGASEWSRDFVPPPFGYLRDEVFIIAVKFDASGRVKADFVVKSTGDPKYDSFALSWVKSYWHHSAYAGHMAQMSIFFNRGQYGFYVQRSG